jgi:hypothetical protein
MYNSYRIKPKQGAKGLAQRVGEATTRLGTKELTMEGLDNALNSVAESSDWKRFQA